MAFEHANPSVTSLSESAAKSLRELMTVRGTCLASERCGLPQAEDTVADKAARTEVRVYVPYFGHLLSA